MTSFKEYLLYCKKAIADWLVPEYKESAKRIAELRKKQQEERKAIQEHGKELTQLVRNASRDIYKPVDFAKFYASLPPGYELAGNTIEEKIETFRKITWNSHRLILQQSLRNILKSYETI